MRFWFTRLLGFERPLRLMPMRAALAGLLMLMVALAWSSVAVPGMADGRATPGADGRATPGADGRATPGGAAGAATGEPAPLGDFALYAQIHQKMSDGAGYYTAAMATQRANNYPTRPFVTVRLPTLAGLHALIGPDLIKNIELLLVLGVAAGFFVAFKDRLGAGQAGAGAVLAMLGGAGVMAVQAPHIHELAAGLLLSLAFVLYRPGRLWPSLLAAACALALRELALPFVLLWLGFACVERRWREAGLLAGMIGLFAGGMALHAWAVAGHGLPGDAASPGWQGLQGLALPLFAMARMSGLTLLPLWLAGPLAILPLIGWAGMGGRAGAFAVLWSAGFFAAMALFARPENFYWVLMVLPLYLAGFAMLPRALGDVLAAATGRVAERQN